MITALIRLLYLLFFIGIAAISTFVFPRRLAEEYHLFLKWKRPAGIADGYDFEHSTEYADSILTVDTRHFMRLDADSGNTLFAGLRSSVFTASDFGFISQSNTVPNWVIQSWDGDIAFLSPRVGLPRLYGHVLVQFSYDQIAISSSALELDPQMLDARFLSSFALSYDLPHKTQVILGDMAGGVILYSYDTSGMQTFTLSPASALSVQASSVVYGTGFLPDNRIFVVQGLQPQRVEILQKMENGELYGAFTYQVPEEHWVRKPVSTIALNQDKQLIMLMDAVVVLNHAIPDAQLIAIENVSELYGAFHIDHMLYGFVANTENDAVIFIEGSSWNTRWILSNTQVVGFKDTIIVVKKNDELLALEVRR